MVLPLAIAQRGEAPGLRSPTASEPTRKFERLLPSQRPPGNWEVSVRVLPWVLSSNGRGRPLFTQPPDGANTEESRQLYTLSDGSSVPLYSQYRTYGYGGYFYGSSYGAGDNRLGFMLGSVEVARRFPFGLRVSVGYSKFSYSFPGKSDPETFRYLMRGADYLLVNIDDGDREGYLMAGFQYTINRRRRLRINLGINLMYNFQDRYATETWLLGPEEGEHHFVSRFEGRYNYNWLVPLPQATFEYRLTPMWAISAGLGGSTGIGITWQPPTRVRWGEQPERKVRRVKRILYEYVD